MRLAPVLFLIGCTPAPFDAPQATPPRVQERDTPVTVWFAPDDDLLSVELAEIERVRLARLADPGAPHGAYAIRYAVYNLRHEQIVQALIDARSAGVFVQILIEADQLDPALDYNWADDYLVLHGFSFAPDHRVLPVDEAAHTELIGIGGSGLMHFKTRLYRTPDGTRLLTGSQNPGDNAMFNDEALHLVRDPDVIAAYERAVDAILGRRDHENVWVDGASVNALFSPSRVGPNAGVRLFDWIAEEDEQILILSFSLRNLTAAGHAEDLIGLLGRKVSEGVPVVLITDRKQSDAWGDPTEDLLRDVGVRVYEATNATTEFTAMHHKSVVLGRTRVRVVTDTANLTTAGFGSATRKSSNHESTLFLEADLDDGRVGRRYLGQFLKVLGKYAHQSASDGEAPYDELADALTAQPGWPALPVRFTVAADTAYGEQVHAVGALPELGSWGAAGWGVPLDTDESTYPMWTSEPVSLPVGAQLRWKYIAVDGGSVRWESGDDRVEHAIASPTALAEELSTVDAWR